MIEAFQIFMLLMVVHFICDYPLQGDFLARAKKEGPLRIWHLFGHSMIHAGGVFLITGSLTLMVTELVAHMFIDEFKNRGLTTFAEDQALHVLCKIILVAIILLN